MELSNTRLCAQRLKPSCRAQHVRSAIDACWLPTKPRAYVILLVPITVNIPHRSFTGLHRKALKLSLVLEIFSDNEATNLRALLHEVSNGLAECEKARASNAERISILSEEPLKLYSVRTMKSTGHPASSTLTKQTRLFAPKCGQRSSNASQLCKKVIFLKRMWDSSMFL